MEEMLKVPEHEKMQEPVPPLTHVEANQEGYRWVAITAMLFAIGIIIGIGFVAGLTLIPSSKSAFPLGNIASELSGATTCCLLVKAFVACHMGDWRVTPFITGFASTFVSGGVFTFILKLVLGLPLKVWIFAMLPVVAVVGVLNGLITFGLFRPVKKLFYAQEGGEDK